MNARNKLQLPCYVALPFFIVAFTIGVAFPTATFARPIPGLVADIDGDGEVNVVDACIMFSNWGMEDLGYAEGNLDGDNYISASDAGIMFENWTGDPNPKPCGDINCDGEVNAVDAGIMFSHWGMEGMGYAEGNIDGDNNIGVADAGIMFENWTGGSGPMILSIPEPSTLLLGALAALGLLMRRR